MGFCLRSTLFCEVKFDYRAKTEVGYFLAELCPWQKSEIISNVNRNETYTTRQRSLARCLHCNSLHAQMVEFGRRLGRGQFVVERCLTRTGPKSHETEK